MPCELTPEERRNIDRRSASDILTLISRAVDQLEYERNVPIVSIPVEMQCQWFDDFYYHQKGKAASDSFSPEELAMLAEFDATFRANTPLLPKDQESVQVWLDDSAWREIMNKAAETLRHWRDVSAEG